MGYFKADNNFIYCDVPYCEFYIPQEYFSQSGLVATDNGDTLTVLGLFDVGIFTNGKVTEWKSFNVPTWIDLYTGDNEIRDVKLPWSKEPVKCRVLKYLKDAKVTNASIIQNDECLTKFISVLCSGAMPKSVPYNRLVELWWKNQDLHKSSLHVPSFLLELILAVLCRDPKDISKKFATSIGKANSTLSEYDYKMERIRTICQFASTFSALTYEDKNFSIITSVNRTTRGATERESPVEAIIKM